MATPETTKLLVPYVTPGEVYAVSIVLPFLGIISVLLRFYARGLQKKSTGIDDWLMLPALILVIGMGISLIIGVHRKAIAYPTPLDEGLTPEEQLTYVNPIVKILELIQFAFIILMVLAFGIIKLSITFYYRRIFVIARGSLFDWITKITLVIVVLWTVGCLFGLMFSCGAHFSANWGNLQESATYCGSSTDINSAFVVSDLITDFLVLCLPLPVIWSLQMTTGRKLVVTGILATGAVSIVASIIKVIISFEITNAGNFTANLDQDLTVSTILYWAMIEAGLAVIAACLPTLHSLVRNASLSSILHSVRSVLSIGSIHTQQQLISQRSPPYSKESYTYIHAGSSASSTFDAARENSKNPIDIQSTDNVDGLSKPQGYGIQVTRKFSQHASMV